MDQNISLILAEDIQMDQNIINPLTNSILPKLRVGIITSYFNFDAQKNGTYFLNSINYLTEQYAKKMFETITNCLSIE